MYHSSTSMLELPYNLLLSVKMSLKLPVFLRQAIQTSRSWIIVTLKTYTTESIVNWRQKSKTCFGGEKVVESNLTPFTLADPLSDIKVNWAHSTQSGHSSSATNFQGLRQKLVSVLSANPKIRRFQSVCLNRWNRQPISCSPFNRFKCFPTFSQIALSSDWKYWSKWWGWKC